MPDWFLSEADENCDDVHGTYLPTTVDHEPNQNLEPFDHVGCSVLGRCLTSVLAQPEWSRLMWLVRHCMYKDPSVF